VWSNDLGGQAQHLLLKAAWLDEGSEQALPVLRLRRAEGELSVHDVADAERLGQSVAQQLRTA
jgi:hypothetical protein